ncbi:ribosome-releasing factor 2, mitochondrial [Gossypium arboreum]|uniref:Ribosome-releasing factor 2, mitochondrial n=1 Tax=Gossypium arboreum TaxID=29729 RepID=A0A0B0MN35_GOSAR|nr:ribosome-releasing factor 2, mitochondrial [Gossypium arboreum]KHG25649.1 ribosome-releasing factor 2, mitochondrial [Gossypium arboreum]
MGSQIEANSPAMVLHDVSYRCQCHILDMVLQGININANAMSQTWSYMGSHITLMS